MLTFVMLCFPPCLFFCIQKSSRDPNPFFTLWSNAGEGEGRDCRLISRGLHCSAEGLYPGNLLPLPETRTHSWDFGKLRRSYCKEWATWGQWGKWCRGSHVILSRLFLPWHLHDTEPDCSSQLSHPAASFQVPTKRWEREQLFYSPIGWAWGKGLPCLCRSHSPVPEQRL